MEGLHPLRDSEEVAGIVFLCPHLRQSQPLNRHINRFPLERALVLCRGSVSTVYRIYGYSVRVTATCPESFRVSDYVYHLQSYLLPRGPEQFTQRGRSAAGGRRSEVVGRPLRAVGTTWRSWSWSGTGWTRWWRR